MDKDKLNIKDDYSIRDQTLNMSDSKMHDSLHSRLHRQSDKNITIKPKPSFEEMKKNIKQNYFIIAKQKLDSLLEDCTKMDQFIEINIFFQEIKKDCQKNVEASRVILHLQNQIKAMEDKTFNWVYEQNELNIIHPLIRFFENIKDINQLQFLDLQPFRDILPIKYFQLYFQHPFLSTEEDVNMYEAIHSFHSDLLSVFNKIYIKSFMSRRPVIDADKIISIDPYMRTTIRKENILFYIENFYFSDNFDLYKFLEQLVEDFALSGAPRWKMTKGIPIFIPLFKMIDDLYKYGLISLEYSRDLLRYYYLICDLIASLERNISEEEFDETDKDLLQKYKKEFIFCREKVSLVLIQIITVFSDVALEETQNQINANIKTKDMFQKFLFKEKAAFNYFSHIVLKYLSQQINLEDYEINSTLLKANLALIFNFIGDYQNDIFKLSMDLINNKNFQFYMNEFSDGDDTEEQMKDDVYFLKIEINKFFDQIQRPKKINVKQLFVSLLDKIEPIAERYQNEIYFKLHLAKRNFPSLFLSIFNFVDDGKNLEIRLVIRALNIMKYLMKNEYVSQGVLFRGSSQRNFESLSRKRHFTILLMVKEVFRHNPYLMFISPKMFTQNLKLYAEFLEDMIKAVKEKQEDLDGKLKIMRLFFFQEYFFNLLETHQIKIKRRKKFDVMLAQEMFVVFKENVLNFFEYIDELPEEEAKNLNLISKLSEMNLNNLEEMYDVILKTPYQVLLSQFFFNFFKLFTKSIYKIYSGELFNFLNVVVEDLDYSLEKMCYYYSDSILLRLEYVKLYDRIRIFFPNHLISDRAKHNPNPTLFIGEVLIPENYDAIAQFIKFEFKWFDKYMNYHASKDRAMINNIIKYLNKGLLVAIYKFLRGIQLNLSILIKVSQIETLNKIVDEIVDILETKYVQFERLFKESINLNTVDKKMNVMDFTREKIQLKTRQDDLDNIKKSFVKIYKEERATPIIGQLRNKLQKGLVILQEGFKNKNTYYLIERYKRDPQAAIKTQYMKSNLDSSVTIGGLFENVVEKKRSKHSQSKKFYTLFKPLKSQYKIMKSYFNHHPEANQFFKILNDNRDMKSVRTFLFFFIDQIQMMELDFFENDHERQFLNNDYFIYFFIIMDNLMQWNPTVRIAFLQILKGQDCEEFQQKVAVQMLQKTFRCFITLYLIVMYKTFMDKEWEEYWSKFVVISTFLQNLCEGNNKDFKEFLNSKQCPGAISFFTTKSFDQANYSLFFELYILLETSCNFTFFWLNHHGEILPSDKEEIFLIIKRLMDHTTEHLTGPCLTNQEKIYRFRIDIWTGIITRVVDNTESNFYQVKMSTLVYISALLEGLDGKIVTLMGSNFQIHTLFDIMVRLVKKLYIRLMRKMKSKKSNKKQKKLIFDENIVTEKDEQNWNIKSYHDLMVLYKYFEKEFADHILMNIVVEIFFLITNMSFKIKFFEYYLKEKKEQILKNYTEDQKQKEENYVFQFLMEITSNVQVVLNDTLQRIYFKKEPKCFLLSEETKQNFIENIDIGKGEAKRKDIFDNLKKFDLEMEHNKRLFQKYKFLYNFQTNDFFKNCQISLYILSIILNIMMLMFLDARHIDDPEVTVPKMFSNNITGENLIQILAFVILIYSIFLSIFWLLTKFPMELRISYAYSNKKFSNKKIENFLIIFKTLIFNARFVSFSFHFLFTMLGLITSNWFYTLNLFLVTNLSKTINYIMKSIIRHYEKLFVSLLLTIFIIFSFSFLFLQYFSEDVNEDDFGSNVCQNYLFCFLNGINNGIRFGGGLSDFLLFRASPNQDKFWSRFFFDIFFFILIQLISLNIFSGIIIDTFIELREEITKRQYNEKFICFICDLDKWNVEKKGQDFNIHRKHMHNIWTYVYFMIRLNSVNNTILNGNEFQIYEFIKKDVYSWLPEQTFLQENENIKKIKPQKPLDQRD